LHRRLPMNGQAVRWLYHASIAAGVCGAGLVALAPVIYGLFWLAPRFDWLYEKFAVVYERSLGFCLRWRIVVLALLFAVLVPAVLGFHRIGQELFPEVDASEFTVHLRATGGPRVEETERQVAEIEGIIREIVAPEDLQLILSNVGISSRWSAIYTSNNGP